ncbi:LamG-like jellyroll fold domain-containing protein [uncultured Planktosalinus sp.]|uniref:LamG-like jellyroll fold domain-containing protein n=1 Tax=uncultured Planktosalinus sp. TaxID=1810935 RepID=UPI0030D98C54
MRKVVDVSNRALEYELINPSGNFEGDVQFSEKGAEFNVNDGSGYILLDSLNLNQSASKNISMWLKFEGEDARIPQMIFSIKDTTDSRKRFNMWIAGRRITAVLNGNHLWANEYDYSKGRSKTYYDSFILEPGKFYFLSVNYTPQKVQIYINAELYQQFDNINDGNISFHQIYLGTERYENEFRNPLIGNIRNLTLFNRTLNVNEIYSLSVESHEAISEFNKAFELKKFNFKQ